MTKNTNKSGFTIIEVVITIAIGAAVMALVLNAVAGARRSQRNNARSADVNQIAAGVNQYIASRNALPTKASNVVSSGGITDSDKFGHYATTSLNREDTLTSSLPANDDDIPVPPTGSTTASISEDQLLIIQKAKCDGNTGDVEPGGIREMAIVYKLEGQSAPSCLEV